jgi:hypothetical protein
MFGDEVMVHLAPPRPPSQLPPLVTVADDDGVNRFRFRLYLISLTALTILITAWFCTLGLTSAIIALVVAKHVLVAILVMGLGVDATRRAGL